MRDGVAVVLLMLGIVVLLLFGVDKDRNSIKDTKVSVTNEADNNVDDLYDLIEKIASVRYYGEVKEKKLKKYIKEEEIDECLSLLAKTTVEDSCDITKDIQSYIEVYKDREKVIKSNPDKSYEAYKKRMSKYNKTGIGDKYDEPESEGDEAEDEEETVIDGMQHDLILPDGRVIWKGVSRKKALRADEYDKDKYNNAVEEYNKELEKIINEQDGLEEQSNRDEGYKVKKMSLNSGVIRSDADTSIMTKKEWEDTYSSYDSSMDSRIKNENGAYKVYYKDLTKDEIDRGYAVLKVHGFAYELDIVNKFGGYVTEGNDDYLYRVNSYMMSDDLDIELTLESNIDMKELKFSLNGDYKIEDAPNLVRDILGIERLEEKI